MEPLDDGFAFMHYLDYSFEETMWVGVILI